MNVKKVEKWLNIKMPKIKKEILKETQAYRK